MPRQRLSKETTTTHVAKAEGIGERTDGAPVESPIAGVQDGLHVESPGVCVKGTRAVRSLLEGPVGYEAGAGLGARRRVEKTVSRVKKIVMCRFSFNR
eukprot:SAG31_NODE_29476_length_394_cov_1.623729_1_plen_97_part_10